jgi:hypothetical protein
MKTESTNKQGQDDVVATTTTTTTATNLRRGERLHSREESFVAHQSNNASFFDLTMGKGGQ